MGRSDCADQHAASHDRRQHLAGCGLLLRAIGDAYTDSDAKCNAYGNSQPDTDRDSDGYSNTQCYAESNTKASTDSAPSPDAAPLRVIVIRDELSVVAGVADPGCVRSVESRS